MKGDTTQKEKINLDEATGDLMFGIWANVQGKNFCHESIKFYNERYQTGLPQKQGSSFLVLRCLWTSFDYLSAAKEQDDLVVGGVVDFQMFHYPDKCETSNSK